MARNTYFVTGTDTDAGKTFATTVLLEAARAQGLRTLAMKPIASGSQQTPDGLRNDDALQLQAAITEDLGYEQVNPLAFEPAIAPHVAAAQAGAHVTAQRLVGLCRGLQMRPGDLLLIEGAGGWRVPLNERETYARVPQELNCPVILVVPLKLGCINHALLSAEAIRRDGLRLAGWVANRVSATPMACEGETFAYLCDHLQTPLLADLPWAPHTPPAALVSHVNLAPLIEK
ncbi:MAG: dethiobiotin synthase [Marinobacter sp.]|nr:dethiobiotin synthase [Marinobacter sp.]